MCGIVGIYRNKNASKLASLALFAMQHRGQEASGICSSEDGKLILIKERGLVSEIFTEDKLNILKGNMAIGHNRYSTSGIDSILDAQPLIAKYKLGELAVVHNGNLINKDEVRQNLIDEGSIFRTELDTENFIHLIARSKKETLQERIIDSLKIVKGAYNLIFQDGSKQIVVRDKYGIRPLSLGKLRNGGYIVASETCSFVLLDAEFIRDIRPGEMLVFSGDKLNSIQLFEPDSRPCSFEYVYFARPDSEINGKNVYKIRENSGKMLADADDVKADMVISVPDSGTPAALGYSMASGIPFKHGIIRNHYVGRTFIEPLQHIRDLKVKIKLSPMKYLIKDKSVIIVDDSIVRGTTSRRIVRMLKNAGVKELHFRVASPEVKFPCFYGIDTPTKEELISSRMNKEELCEYIGADSLKFLSISDLRKAIGTDINPALEYFNGDYFIK